MNRIETMLVYNMSIWLDFPYYYEATCIRIVIQVSNLHDLLYLHTGQL